MYTKASCNPHSFPSSPPLSGENCVYCGIIFCVVAYDHDDDYGKCAVCGWDVNA